MHQLSFAQHLHELHEHIWRQIAISNDNYKSVTDSYKRLQKIAIGDEVMVRVYPKRFPPRTLKKLHARRMGPYKALKRFGSNAYKLDIPYDLGINPVFNVENFDSLSHSSGLSNSYIRWANIDFQESPAVPSSRTITTTINEAPHWGDWGYSGRPADGTYHRYLVCWRGRPDFDCIWLRSRGIMQLNPELLHDFHRRHSPEVNFWSRRQLMGIRLVGEYGELTYPGGTTLFNY